MSSRSKYQDVTKSRRGNRRIMESIKKQARDTDLWRAAAAEFLATFIFIFIVCVANMMPNSAYDISATDIPTSRISLQSSVGIALTYATLIQSFEHISGGHMNPAISVAMVIAGNISVFKAVVYVVSQLAGAFSAVALCFGMLPFNTRVNSVSQLNLGIQPLQGFGIEVLQTIVVTVTWLATLATSKSQLGSSALPVGMAFLANSLWAGQLTGSCMNPARSLSTALLSHYIKDLWVYVAGPFLGCIVGAILYTQVFVLAPKRPGSSTITESSRSAEGQSVQSDQDATEMMPLTRITATPRHSVPNGVYTSIQMTPQHPEAIVSSGQQVLQRVSQQPQNLQQQQVYYTPTQQQQLQPNLHQCVNVVRHQSTPMLYHPATPQQPQTPSQATTQLLQNLSRPVNPQHQTLPSAVRRLNANGQRYPVTHVTTQGTAVTRPASRPSRPSTACGTQLTPSSISRTHSVNNYENPTRIVTRSNAATPAAGFRSISASETYSESSDGLLNSSVL